MSITAVLGELSAKREQIEAAAREQAKAILAPGLQEFMNSHPDVKAIGWTQYTPYFNDGEECIFGVHGLHASAKDERDDSLYGDGWEEIYSKVPEGFSPESWKALQELESALSGGEPELKAAFGDHVQVIVTRDGVDIDSYDHD
jgi:hypothetical protein